MIFEFRKRLVIVVTNITTVSFSRTTLLCGILKVRRLWRDARRTEKHADRAEVVPEHPILFLGARWCWGGVVVSFTHRRLNLLAKRPRFPLNKRLGGQQNLFGRLWEKRTLLPVLEVDPLFQDFPASSPLTVVTELSRLRSCWRHMKLGEWGNKCELTRLVVQFYLTSELNVVYAGVNTSIPVPDGRRL